MIYTKMLLREWCGRRLDRQGEVQTLHTCCYELNEAVSNDDSYLTHIFAQLREANQALTELDNWIDELNKESGLEPPLDKMPNFDKWLDRTHGGTQ